MINVDMDLIKLGQRYTANVLANLWGYQSHHPLVKGMVTPKGTNIIILFVTKEKQKGATPYVDEIRGNILYMMGQEKHGSDKRLLENLNINKDSIFLFYRELHHTPFEYCGRFYLIGAEVNEGKPSEFELLIENLDDGLEDEAEIVDYIVNLPTETGEEISLLIEGAKKITQHVRYERNPFLRKKAIRIQGRKCKICGFDFNIVYGEDLADGYIEVHHIKHLAEGERNVNPATDLIPVCANCHRMLHRKKKNNVLPAQLKELIKMQQGKR